MHGGDAGRTGEVSLRGEAQEGLRTRPPHRRSPLVGYSTIFA
jgi:hypothetical protein